MGAGGATACAREGDEGGVPNGFQGIYLQGLNKFSINLQMSIPVYTLDSSRAPTELCRLGEQSGTDKSPYNRTGHRHPYTPFYSMMLAPYKNKPIQFAEIGVAGGASVLMWSRYFSPSAQLSFYDRDQNFLNNAQNFGIPNANFHIMDIKSPESIREGFQATGGSFDIIVDDSTHDVWDQKILLGDVFPFLKPGGLMIIEDVFKNVDNSLYYEIIKPHLDQLAFYGFYEMEHSNKYSPGWDNDKVLMLVKN